MTTYPMSPGDAAWFHMDGPANLAIVTGLLLTTQALDFGKVRKVFRERLLKFPRFRQRVVEIGLPVATPHWKDMPRFDIDQHLHHIALAAPHNQNALRILVSDLASTALDHNQPLWQVHVVDEVDGGSALIMRVHHCVADGAAMMTIGRALFDSAPDVAASEDSLNHATAAAPVAAPATLIDQTRLVLGGAGMLVSELLKTDDPPSPFKGKFSMRKCVAWSKPVALQDIKAIAAPYGAKINDVLVAAMTGALRSYLADRGVDVNHSTLRAMVPVDLRTAEHSDELGNEFGLVILELALTKASPQQRISTTKARMDALKKSPEAMATQVLLDLLGRGPKVLEDFSNELFGAKASLVMTNVVGPRQTLYLAGVPIDRILGWAPHPGKQLGMAISILSYRGMACVTVIGDAHLVPDPEKITDEFHYEFLTMLKAAKAGHHKAGTQ